MQGSLSIRRHAAAYVANLQESEFSADTRSQISNSGHVMEPLSLSTTRPLGLHPHRPSTEKGAKLA